MTSDELRTALNAAGIAMADAWVLPDVTFEPCSLEFVSQNWDAWLAARPPQLLIRDASQRVLPRWVAEAGDCDNLALGTMVWAQVGNALAAVNRGVPRGGIAYGALAYFAEQRLGNYGVTGAHAINWFVDYDVRVRFFEPGVGREVDLTSNERISACLGIAA